MRLRIDTNSTTFVSGLTSTNSGDHRLVRGLNWVKGMLWFSIPLFFISVGT